MLQVNKLTFSYKKQNILNEISFNVTLGEHLSIIGESGSGKTTLLKLLYGEYDLNEGTIFWKDQQILGPKFNLVIGYDFMKYVSQEFDLMPYTSVEENIGKFLSNFYREEKRKRTAELLDIVELTQYAKTKVKALSGGQKQRVALARALAKQPEVILLDEPFSHIDSFKKQSLRRNIFKYLKDKKITCIVATHDKDDVLGYSDKILFLNNNRIEAYDTPENLYSNPKTSLVAAFFSEFNSINDEIVYAHQLKIVEHSNLKVLVLGSYFKGNYYLIEVIHEHTFLFFEHHVALEPNSEIFLKISK
ncbi:ABC transporter ATP-binding protein [uncultured Psychroserpens sp.]|uniref:ABC transporter ATP-binding protein n=1 Tax=uncultured Psychroserpens sp. TaxID=255436 RepID=UPI00261963A3|nr:ABC transporter ATP-binding protein [uncultured Psychroserpens sp.]